MTETPSTYRTAADAYERVIAHPHPAHSDARGDITNILSGELAASVQHIALITSAKDSIRGNHRHPATQYIYVVSGAMESYSGTRPDVRRITAVAGDLLYCPPGVPHAYRFLRPTTFLNLDCAPRGEYGVDTEPYEVLLPGERPT